MLRLLTIILITGVTLSIGVPITSATPKKSLDQYVENFESNDGGYEPVPSNGAWEWGIPTSGPGSAHSGSKLWATVLAGQYQNYVSWKLTSCNFQATFNNPELRFWHWYAMEDFCDGGNVKLSIDSGNTWTIIHPQGDYPCSSAFNLNFGIPNEPCYTSLSTGWQEAIFTLPVDSGQIFQLRWHFGSDPSITEDGWYVDDVSGTGFNIIAHDVGATRIVEPIGAVRQDSIVTPKVIIYNFGSNSETFPVIMKIGSVYCETLSNVSLNTGQVDTVSFPTWTAILGNYLVTAFTILVGDMDRGNDTVHDSVEVGRYIEDFESNNGGFGPVPDTGAWEWGIPISWPRNAHSGAKVWGTVLEGNYQSDANWKLTSIFFRANRHYPQLHFWHWYSIEPDVDGGNVKISTDYQGITWTIVTPQGGYPGTASGDNAGIPGEPCYNGTTANEWREATFTLPVISGQPFQLRWHFGSDWLWNYRGWYIDDVLGDGFDVLTVPISDVGVTSILEPFGAVLPNSIVTPKVIIRNYGLANETFPVIMKIDTVYCETLPDVSLNVGQIDTVEFPDWTTPNYGTYATTAFTALASDINLTNDTVYGSVAVVQYIQNFESNNGGYKPVPDTGAWEWGIPTSGPGSAHSGIKLWATILGGSYQDNANWKLTSIYYQASQNNPELLFCQWYEMENHFDGGNIKISTNRGISWTIISPRGGYPENVLLNNALSGEPGYSGSSNGWQEAVFTLPVDSGQIFQLRWHFGSDDSYTLDGWYIDDIAYLGFNIISHDVGATSIIEPFGVMSPVPVYPKVIINNFGANNETLSVVMQIGAVYCETLTNVLLNAGQVDTVTFPNWMAFSGNYIMTAYTVLVGDMNPENDTVRGSLTVAQYGENFESNNGGYASEPSSGAWEWGIPTSGPGRAHTGLKTWGTILAGQYRNNVNWRLNSCEFKATQNNPELSFWHWFETESDSDGGNVKISTNCGASWTIIQPQGGYPCSSAASGNIAIPSEPCYSGSSDTWCLAFFTLPVNNGQIFQLRWHFGSNRYINNYHGWFIDDVASSGFEIAHIEHDVGATKILSPSGPVQQGASKTPTVVVRNFGINAETSPLIMMIGSVYCETLPSVSLNPEQIDTIEFPVWTADSGTYTTTSFTNLTDDTRRLNDTTHGSTTVLVFVEDFETYNQLYVPNPATDAWEWGIPTSGPYEAHSGIKVWGTVLAGQYRNNANWVLSSSGFHAIQDNPEIDFWHWYDIAPTSDFGRVEMSTDLGYSWRVITPLGGYPSSSGYSGRTNNWVEAVFVLPVNNLQTFKLRWRFRSYYNEVYAGWYIDDVSGSGFVVGLDEDLSTQTIVQRYLDIQPNPCSKNGVKIAFGVTQVGKGNLSVYDVSGCLVKTLAQRQFIPGNYTVRWNATDNIGRKASSGIYFLIFSNIDGKLSKKLIINK